MIAALGLAPHPEGGWYRELWSQPAADGTRPGRTMIHYLLGEGEASHWHRIDAEETWLHLAGAALALRMAATASGPARRVTLAPCPSGAPASVIVAPGHWQAATTTGAWTLAACIVAPGFRFDGFELAPPDFDISD